MVWRRMSLEKLLAPIPPPPLDLRHSHPPLECLAAVCIGGGVAS